MKKLMILAGVAAFGMAAPALADSGHGHGKHRYGAWGNSCPPGLAKKRNGCMPPGHAKRYYNRGQHWSGDHGYRWSYSQIPTNWRTRYNLRSNDRYYYRDGYLYSVDPTTMLVQQVIRAIL